MASSSAPTELRRLLDVDMVRYLTDLRDAAPADEQLREAFNNAQFLAGGVLSAPEPPAPVPAAASGPTLAEFELEEARADLTLAVAERNAARDNAASLQQQLTLVNSQLTNALTLGAAQAANGSSGGGGGDGNAEGSGGYHNVPEFDGSSPTYIRTWIILLRNKLAAQAHRYPSENAKLRYALGRLAGDALDMVRSHVSEDTGDIAYNTLNEMLAELRQTYDDPDRAQTARTAIKKLEMQPLQFSRYLAAFRRLMGDLDWDDGAQRDALKDGLTTQMRRSLEYRPVAKTLAELISLCVEYDARHRAAAAEEAAKKPARPAPVASVSRPVASSSSASSSSRPAASFSAPRPAATVAHPTDANSGHYGTTPMNLSSAERLQVRNERMARGECTYCGVLGHFRKECAKRLAKEARDLRAAAVFAAPAAPAVAVPAESGNALSHAA
jgi:hypothetical protein